MLYRSRLAVVSPLAAADELQTTLQSRDRSKVWSRDNGLANQMVGSAKSDDGKRLADNIVH